MKFNTAKLANLNIHITIIQVVLEINHVTIINTMSPDFKIMKTCT